MARRQGTTIKSSASARRRRLRRGEEAVYLAGRGRIPALVLEDRGPLASGGRHVFRIAIFPKDADQRDEFEAVEDSLEPAA